VKKKKNNLLPSPVRRAYNICRQDIGYKLFCLRQIKQCPDNYDKGYVERIKIGLSVSMSWYHRLIKESPFLKEAVQCNLFKQETK